MRSLASSSDPWKHWGTPSHSCDSSNNCSTSVDSFTWHPKKPSSRFSTNISFCRYGLGNLGRYWPLANVASANTRTRPVMAARGSKAEPRPGSQRRRRSYAGVREATAGTTPVAKIRGRWRTTKKLRVKPHPSRENFLSESAPARTPDRKKSTGSTVGNNRRTTGWWATENSRRGSRSQGRRQARSRNGAEETVQFPAHETRANG